MASVAVEDHLVVRVTFVHASGARSMVETMAGETLMRAAVNNDIREIRGECGGACCCATCHVYIDDPSVAQAAPIGDMERQMLEYVAAARLGVSRLACQVVITPEMNDLMVRLPPAQRDGA